MHTACYVSSLNNNTIFNQFTIKIRLCEASVVVAVEGVTLKTLTLE